MSNIYQVMNDNDIYRSYSKRSLQNRRQQQDVVFIPTKAEQVNIFASLKKISSKRRNDFDDGLDTTTAPRKPSRASHRAFDALLREDPWNKTETKYKSNRSAIKKHEDKAQFTASSNDYDDECFRSVKEVSSKESESSQDLTLETVIDDDDDYSIRDNTDDFDDCDSILDDLDEHFAVTSLDLMDPATCDVMSFASDNDTMAHSVHTKIDERAFGGELWKRINNNRKKSISRSPEQRLRKKYDKYRTLQAPAHNVRTKIVSF